MNPTILLVCLQLNLSGNQIGAYFNGSEWVNTPEGPKAIADALGVNASLTKLDVQYNSSMGEKGEAALRKAVKGRSGFELII